jgi:integrase
MGRPKLGYHIRRDRGERSYLRVEGYDKTFAFATRNPTKAEIADALAAIKAGPAAQPRHAKPLPAEKDTLRALADAYYKSKQFLLDIGEVTRTARRNAIEALLATLTPEGKRPRAQIKLYDLKRKHILAIQAEAMATPETANIRVKVLRYMYAFALDTEWPGVIANPAKDVKLLPPKVKTTADGNPYTGHREWTLADAERFLDFYHDDVEAFTTVSLLLYTGARVSDAYKLSRTMESIIDWRGTPVRCLKFKVTKGSEKRARDGKVQVQAVVPMVPQFVQAMERTRPDSLVYLTNELKRPWKSPKALGNKMHKWCNTIVDEDGTRPFAGLSSHGLRKASAAWWVKTYRCSTHDLMAIFGWLTEKEALHYTVGYDREDAAAGVVLRFPTARTG